MLCERDGRPMQRRPNQICWVGRVNWETLGRTGSYHCFSLVAREQALAESLPRSHLSSSKACGSRYCRRERPPLGYGDNSWTPTYPASDDWAGHMIRMKDERLPKRSETRKQGFRKRGRPQSSKTLGLFEDSSRKSRGGRKVERKG